MGLASEESDKVDLGDKRLDKKSIKPCDSFSESPESPLNQACEHWRETKTAYRFFQNENVDAGEIMEEHRDKTSTRASNHRTILALQDTSDFVYTNHPKFEGLGAISTKKGKNAGEMFSQDLAMRTCLAVTTDGTPLGLLDQKIFARDPLPDHALRDAEWKKKQKNRPAEEKESIRWIEPLEKISKAMPETQVVTVCDRECDFYDVFATAEKTGSEVLVRATKIHSTNKNNKDVEDGIKKEWKHIASEPEAGTYSVDISEVKKTQKCKWRKASKAKLSIKCGTFKIPPPTNNPKNKTKALSDIKLYAIYAYEKNPPEGEEAVGVQIKNVGLMT